MKLTQKQVLIILGGGFLLVALIFILAINATGRGGGGGGGDGPRVELIVCGVDEGKAFQGVISGYEKFRDQVKVEYKQIDGGSYESLLLNALASGQGPDVFMINNRALPKEIGKLVAANPSQLDLIKFQSIFPQVAEQDFVREAYAYAAPLYIDTLALLYNKDFFDQAGVISPPKTWEEFQQAVSALRVLGSSGELLRAGAAIGGSERSVRGASDILNFLMLQNGTKMVNDVFKEATFNNSSNRINPGLEAFNFYLQFANAASPYYTWNDNQPSSLDSFAAEKTAMAFGYLKDIKLIQEKNPFLNFGLTGAPQTEGASKAVSYANYHGLAVSKQSQNGGWGWDFVVYMTTRPEVVSSYLKETGRPPAIRDPLIKEKLNDLEIGLFARQALTARSWPQIDEAKIRKAFSDAISSVLNGQRDSARALDLAENQVSELMRKAR